MAVKGLTEFKRKLARIPKAAKEHAALSVVKSGNELAALQKRLAPVDDSDLKNSVTVTPPGGTTPPYSQPGGSRQAHELQALVTAGNTKVRYAHLVEFGTAPHINGGWAAGTQHPGTAPQPFFWPAYRALRRRLKSRTSRDIRNGIKKAAQT